MKPLTRIAGLLLMLGLGLLLSGRVAAQEAPVDGTTIATRLLDHLDAGRYADAEAMFGADMAKAVPADKLKAVWESLPAQVGAAHGRGDAATMQQGDATLVQVPLQYAKAALVAKIAIDATGKIVGFLIQPAAAPAAVAPVAEDANFGERDFSVGDDGRALPGTLAMPKGEGPFPAVVLVHGSGAHDRDESIGPNKPFLDIARGLAAQGIAVLRYDKRTKARPQDYDGGDFTLDLETTDDAVMALEQLRTHPGIDGKRVFVLGHSQGGMVAPRAADRSKAAGAILLAAPARPLFDIIVDQNQHLLASGNPTANERALVEKLVREIDAFRHGGALPTGFTEIGYWKSTEIDPVAEARAIHQPLLLLQGARDIQVFDADWQRWLAAFGQDARVTFHRYPALNHLGIAGKGPGNIEEYQTTGHVDAQLIDDVARWIQAH